MYDFVTSSKNARSTATRSSLATKSINTAWFWYVTGIAYSCHAMDYNYPDIGDMYKEPRLESM
jgi:hypothetical protein